MKTNMLLIAALAAGLVVVFYSTKRWAQQKAGGEDGTPASAVAAAGAASQERAKKSGGVSPSEQDRPSRNIRHPSAGGELQDAVAATEEVQVPPGKVSVKTPLPKPVFEGTQKEVKGAFNLEQPRGGKPYPAILVPVGCDKQLALNCKVTSSDPDPIIGELAYITDGDKEHDAATYVELGPGLQWVQIDLGKECEIYGACVWHYHGEGRVYRDVICQISDDADFIDGVVTVFNNDHDNSAKLGAGKDKEYIETHEGRPFPIDGVRGRYVRFYSRGNTSNEMNHYTEIEVYGKGD